MRRCQAHLDLELLHQFTGLELLRLVLDLDLLLIHVAHRHIHARFVDCGHLFDLAHHLVVSLADPSHLELFHSVGDFLLPLSASIVGNSIQSLLRLAFLFSHEGLFYGHCLIESRARVAEVPVLHRPRRSGISFGNQRCRGQSGRGGRRPRPFQELAARQAGSVFVASLWVGHDDRALPLCE